ncbi:hypothetical protein [Streptomyces sp. NPDC101115]|uniref:hypothetical protein n=1 Tax=Streptomyces sp. NPDC101115 TaxID=3366106 RepID=UPI003817A6DB
MLLRLEHHPRPRLAGRRPCHQVTIDDPAGGHTDYTYNALGQLTSQAEKISATDQITTSFGYDANGNRTRLTDGRGNTTTYTFNSWNLPESTIEPVTPQHPALGDRSWTTTYDAAGQALNALLPGNVTRQRTYDRLSNLTAESGTGAGAATEPRSLTYDLDGRLTSAATSSTAAANTYTYNDRGMLLHAQGPAGETRYTYDADGAMTARTDSAGQTTYTYDTAGRLDLANDPLTGTQIRYDFDAAGRATLEQYARPGAGETFSIDAQRKHGPHRPAADGNRPGGDRRDPGRRSSLRRDPMGRRTEAPNPLRPPGKPS